MATTISAQTLTLAASATTSLGGVYSFPGRNVRMLIRAGAQGVFFGDKNVSSTGGFELVADREYDFVLVDPGVMSGSSSDYQPHIYNNSGASVVVTYLLLPTP